MKQNKARFESFPWEYEILKLEVLFDAIDDFLTDEQIKKSHLEQKNTMFTDDTLGDPKQLLLAGVQVFRRQMVVLLKTYLEQIIKDFSRNVFIGRPEGFLLLDKFKNVKSAEELERMLAENKTVAPNELPKIAADQVAKGRLPTALNRVEKISDAKIKEHTRETLVKLSEIRNHIVHETSDKEISPEFLHESFEAVRDLIVSFREVCELNNILDVDDWEDKNELD